MLGFRVKLNNDPELVKLLCTRFVPVAVDHEVERRNDAEGELYRKAAGKAVSNSVFAFDPSGKLLFQRLGGEIYQKFAPALEAAIKDYQTAKAAAKKVPAGADRDAHFYPVPTDAVVVHCLIFKQGQRTRFFRSVCKMKTLLLSLSLVVSIMSTGTPAVVAATIPAPPRWTMQSQSPMWWS